LTGSRYILKDDHPYCIGCYEEQFAHDCEECKKKIGTDSKVKFNSMQNYILVIQKFYFS
jgi:hypothetical protein